MRAATGLLIPLLTTSALGSASCALVMGYGDYTEGSTTTSAGGRGGGPSSSVTSTTVSAGGAGTTSSTESTSIGGGGGGGLPALAADWSYRGGDSSTQVFTYAALTPSGHVLVAGDYNGTMDLFGDKTVTSSAFALVAAKIDAATGAPVWTTGALPNPPTGTTPPHFGVSMAAGANGAVYLTTTTGGVGVLSALDGDTGAEAWRLTFDGGAPSTRGRIAIDGDGRIRMAGDAANGTFTLGGAAAPDIGPGGKDIAVATCAPPCDAPTIALLGGPLDDTAYAIVAEPKPAGAVFITGEYQGAWGGMPDTKSVGAAFVMKVSDAGALLWARGFVKTQGAACSGEIQKARGTGLALTSTGDVVVTGVVCGSTSFGVDASNVPVTLPGHGGADAFVAKLDGATGNVAWATSFGDAGEQIGSGVAVGPSDRVFLTGTFSGTIDLGKAGILSAVPVSQSIFLLELDASGEPRRGAAFGPGEAIEGRSLAIAAGPSAVVIAGGWKSTLAFGDGKSLDPHGALDAFLAKLTP